MREKKNEGLENDVLKTHIRRSFQDVFQYFPAEPFKDVRIWTSFEQAFFFFFGPRTDWERCFSVNIRMQVDVIYNLNRSLQFQTINFTFSLLRIFTLAHDLMSLNFCVGLLFGRVILSHALQDLF